MTRKWLRWRERGLLGLSLIILCVMMENIWRKLKRGVDVVRDEGVSAFLGKTGKYLKFQLEKRRRKTEMRDILFVNGCTLPHPERYRVDHQMEQLMANGLTVDKILYTELSADKEILKYYRGVVFFRCPITDDVKKLIQKAHYFNKAVFFDVDDLVIDKKYTDGIDYVQKMSAEDKKLYDDGVVRMGETMELCDYCITTTKALARELEGYGKEVFVNKNVASEEMVKLSTLAVKNVKRDEHRIRIGYLSGSITHNPDFELIKPALLRIMEEFPNVDLCVMGYLDVPEGFEKFSDRIVRKPFADWRKLPEVIASLDINLAPIEETIFNEAKSENKWTEASLCKVVTVASDFGAFREVIKDGETGILCKDSDSWYEGLKKIITDKKLRWKIAEGAYDVVMKEYVTTYSGGGLAKFIESKLKRNIAFVLPSTNISGGVNVVLRHCEILRRNGWDVLVINMDASDENICSEMGEINVVSGVRHDVVARFDTMVATLFTTLKYIKKYPDVKHKKYLVQNFETDFNDFGSPARLEANATYIEGGDIEYITISKWCKEWLKNNYDQNAKYAPNGIDTEKFLWRERKFEGKIKILIEGNSDDYYKNVDESFRVANELDRDKYEVTYLSYQGKPKDWYKVDKFYHRVPYEEVGKIYGECDILLKTSILESFSYPPLEMLATGGYVVVLPNGGNKEYLKDEVNCLFYEKGDVSDCLKKIEIIANDEGVREKLMEGAKETIKGRGWVDIEDKVLDLYR